MTITNSRKEGCKRLNVPQLMVISERESEEYFAQKQNYNQLKITRIDLIQQINIPSTRPETDLLESWLVGLLNLDRTLPIRL
jgi:hypothetical protein